MSPALQAAIAGFVCGLAFSFVVRALALRFGIVNHPNPIVPQHVTAVAYLGGVAVYLGMAGGIAFVAWQGWSLPGWALAAPATLFCLLGAYDDLRPLRAFQKLALQVCIAGLAAWLGLRVPISGIGIVDASLAALWIVVCVNAFNLTDVCDGLVTGLAAAFFFVWLIAMPGSAILAAISLGACLGFMPFNLPRASMFLGDAGSHLLGFVVAAVALGAPSRGFAIAPELILLAFVPLFELVFLCVVRIRKGLKWYQGSPDHFALRLQAAGWSRWHVDVVAWSLMAGSAALAVTLHRFDGGVRALIGVAVICACVLAARFLQCHEVVKRD
jgi:UDP-GlcNAc:undecaprenyl-phosphate/decaprenyl-phosphate GlcNAc-1-phosphate transferase